MNETRQEQIARYVAGYTGSRPKPVLTTWLIESVAILDGWDISEPTKADYQRLKFELIATKRGKKGSSLSEGQADKYITATKNFYKWLKQQEGEKQQMSLFEETEATRANEPEGAEALQHGDIEPVSSEGVAECADHGASVQKVTTEEKDTVALSPVDTHSNEAVPVQEATIAPKPKNKGGRKILDPNGEKRSEKVMIYLRPSLYVDVKDWANLHGKTITDCIIGMIEGYMQGKQEKLALFRELRDNE